MSSEVRPIPPAHDGHASDAAIPAQTPIHHAIDRLTVALLELQRIRHRIAAGTEAWEHLAGDLRFVEQALEDLGAVLIRIRDA